MNKIIFRIIYQCSKIIKYILIFVSFMMLLGTILSLFFKDKILKLMTQNYNLSIMEGVSFPFIIYCCISGCIIVICLVLVFDNLKKLMLNLSNENYFVEENANYCKKIFLFLMTLTILKLIAELIFRWLYVNNVSMIFEMSFKNYFVNIMFIILSYASYLVFKNGKSLKDDSESII